MQPLPSTISPTATTEPVLDNATKTDQHGFHHAPVGEGSPPAASSRPNPGPELATAIESIDTSSEDSRTGHHSEHERLNYPGGTSSPVAKNARNRVLEYERAATPPSRKKGGPTFEVVKSSRPAGDKKSPISELPNEVLTHALAHLSPSDLATVALVSKRFHDLVTTPHAWRSAFARFFPGPDSVDELERESDEESQAIVRTERRAFTRLTPLASWRSEYILRTRLLRSLARGKPIQDIGTHSARSGQNRTVSPDVRYKSQLLGLVNHLHATWGTGLNKRTARFIHAADDVGGASTSDPMTGKVDRWGLAAPPFFTQFIERFPGDAQYGLGSGDVVGVPNVMDVSQPYGMIHGEGFPGGALFYRSSEEMRGRILPPSSATSTPELGIVRIPSSLETVCSVWIAKSNAIPELTDGLVGILSGSSLGVLTAYSLGSFGTPSNRSPRFSRGEMTARWVLSPGVPLIAIAVDNDYSLKRQAQNRIWAIVLNALGEVFYLTKFPHRSRGDVSAGIEEGHTAWLVGRSVCWHIAEASRRRAKPDPYHDSRADGSYSPRSSWNGMCLSKEQIRAETHEIEAYLAKKPKDFQKLCLGWDMRRKLEIDFASEDDNNAGEAVVVFDCGIDEDSAAAVKRYTRLRFHEKSQLGSASTPSMTNASTPPSKSPSLFGNRSPNLAQPPSLTLDSLGDSLAQDDFGESTTPRPMCEEWRVSTLSFGSLKKVRVLATAIDSSLHAIQTNSEDPLLNSSARSAASSPALTPMSSDDHALTSVDVPGQRARLIAAGTHVGSIVLWNVRASTPTSSETVNTIEPVRMIFTESPQISCLALSSLYLVHGGNDGLVQAWDPLASHTQPVRTLNSRFSSRARRRLVQAEASPQGVGINLFAAGAICLDPDPTVLRGLVSLGTNLRYWAYSSTAADQYKSHKRRLRRSERGSHNSVEQFSGTTRVNLKTYIAGEKHELERQQQDSKKQAERLAGRFGTDLLDGSEEEMMAYAAMLSQETLAQENLRRASDTASPTDSTPHSSGASVSVWSSDHTATPAGSPLTHPTSPKADEEMDADLAEAIRQSLAMPPALHAHDIPIRQAKPKGRKGSSTKSSPKPSPLLAGSSKTAEMSDLDFAMQLSLAEEASKNEAEVEDFPSLQITGKGKQRQS